jgi:hypothetical protein
MAELRKFWHILSNLVNMNKTQATHTLLSILLSLLLHACVPFKKIEHCKTISQPDYALENSWIALPTKFDAADCIPQTCAIPDNQDSAAIDVFYVYPTTYIFGSKWNMNIDNMHSYARIGNIVESQASIFNACAKVYAPLYRQAILQSFINKKSGPIALDIAYSDVKAAFNYYITYYNNGRPFMLAGHSQGTRHLTRLIQEEIDGKEIQKLMVAAYLIGMPISDTTFNTIPLATDVNQINCFITWNSFMYGTDLKNKNFFFGGSCVNPLTWKTDTTYASSSLNKGGAPRRLNQIDTAVCGAQIHNDVLWVNKIKHKGYIHIGKSYHLSDYRLFYINIRENAIQRTNIYLKTSQK